ncbi:MAG: hypothetical protein KAW52_03400 [candidate division Zixibacteria bacterium]|nr:hypothetical protein [candidate division Zixibacteria bacterium]
MAKITNDQVDFMREDMENNFGYTKIMMISNFINECKKENPDISREEMWERIKEFRKEKGWDVPDQIDGETK